MKMQLGDREKELTGMQDKLQMLQSEHVLLQQGHSELDHLSDGTNENESPRGDIPKVSTIVSHRKQTEGGSKCE